MPVFWFILGGALLWWLASSSGRSGPEGLRRPTPDEAQAAIRSYGDQRLSVQSDVPALLAAFGDPKVSIESIEATPLELSADADLLDYVYDLPKVAGLLRRLAAMRAATNEPYKSLTDSVDKAFGGIHIGL